MPAGIVATDDGRIVGALDDGPRVVDPDDGAWQLLSPYPEGLGARANDLCADLDGDLVTGTLNMGPGDGSTWWFSASEGWRLLDDDITNTNGPTVGELDGAMTLIVGDTGAHYFTLPVRAGHGSGRRANHLRRRERPDRRSRRVHPRRGRRAVVRALRRRAAGPLHDRRARPHRCPCRSPTRRT